jgi:cell wall-associated NlpC family hydrolase
MPLDILFFNIDSDPYGAHIGIYIGSNKVVHLSEEVGYTTVWDLDEFKKRERYKCFLGAKRLLK